MATCKECSAEVEKVCDKCEKCDGHCKCGKEATADAGEEASEGESEEKTD